MPLTTLLKVETPNEMSRQFDSIAYDKAGSVMLFIREMIGADNWIEGKRPYKKNYSGGDYKVSQMALYKASQMILIWGRQPVAIRSTTFSDFF